MLRHVCCRGLVSEMEGKVNEMSKVLEAVFDEMELLLARRAVRRLNKRAVATNREEIIMKPDGPFQAQFSKLGDNKSQNVDQPQMVKKPTLIVKLFALTVLTLWNSGTGTHGQELRDSFRSVQQAVVIVRTEEKGVAPF